jgi:DNA-binding MarR family transcriptional regulator
MRRLTDRQVAVLAAIERHGNPTMAELRGQLHALAAGAIARVVDALEQRGLVARTGDDAVRFVAIRRGRAWVPGSDPEGAWPQV